jgi:exodeoxyribonuclease VII small subunit
VARKKKAEPLAQDLTYKDALQRLQQIVEHLQEGEVDVDALARQVEEATLLMRFCREKLRGAESRVNELLNDTVDEQTLGDSGDR